MQFANGWSQHLYEAFTKFPRFEVLVVALPRKQPPLSEEWLDMNKNIAFLLRRNIYALPGYNNVTQTFLNLQALTPDIVFTPTPYDCQRPEAFSIDTISKFTRVCHVQYAFQISGGVFHENLYKAPFYRKCWKVFVESKEMQQHFSEAGVSDNIVLSGYPKLDGYDDPVDQTKTYWAPREKGEDPSRKILWAPHFNLDEGTSTFPQYHDFMLSMAQAMPQLKLVFRPHPMLFETLVQTGTMRADDLEIYLKEFRATPNAIIDESPEYLDTFRTSDILITDNGSFLGMYLPTGKPIIYTHAYPNDKHNLNALGKKLLPNYYIARNAGELAHYMVRVGLHGEDPLRKLRKRSVRELIFRPKGGASAFIRDHLIEEREPVHH